MRAKKKTRVYDPFGSSVREQIGRTLTQVGVFTVIEQPRRRTARALSQSIEANANEVAFANQEEPELLLSGTLINYTPSQTSLQAGLSADPLLGAKEGFAIEKLFKLLSERAPEGPDRIAFEVELTDAKTNRSIRHMSFDCLPLDWAEASTDLFDEKLRTALPPPQTPMQKATQACLAKTANWIGEQYLAWRENPSRLEEAVFDPRIKKIQQGLNRLGYECGKEDGIRGARTEECMTKFLSARGIQEADLERTLEKELAAIEKRPKAEAKRRQNNIARSAAQPGKPDGGKPLPPPQPSAPQQEEDEWEIDE
jgi:hypothetical protein